MNDAAHLGFESAYERRVLLAVELLDTVSLTRVSDGMKVIAHGLQGKPIVNRSGCFVWLEEKNPVVEKITVDPGSLPYEKVELTIGITYPLTTIKLQPTAHYQFPKGVSGLRGTLIESNLGSATPVARANVQLAWLDGVGNPQPAQTESLSDEQSGDFVSFLRLSPTDEPKIDDNGAFEVQLVVERGATVRRSNTFKLPLGTVVEPSINDKQKFAWDELHP